MQNTPPALIALTPTAPTAAHTPHWRPLVKSFALALLAMSVAAGNAVAADRFEGRTPDNEVEEAPNLRPGEYSWVGQVFDASHTSERDVLYGFRGEGSSDYPAVLQFIPHDNYEVEGGVETTDIVWTAPSTTLFVRPWTENRVTYTAGLGTDLWTEGLRGSLTRRVLNVTIDSALDIDIVGFTRYTNRVYPRDRGLFLRAYGDPASPTRITGKENVLFLKPVTIAVENNSEKDEFKHWNYSYGISVEDSHGASSDITFRAPVQVTTTTQLTRPVTGIRYLSERAGTGAEGSHLRFEDNATFITSAHRGGRVVSGDFFVKGWRQPRLTVPEGMEDVVSDLFVGNTANSTLTFEAAMDHVSESTVSLASNLVGFRESAYWGGALHNALEGKVRVTTQGDDINAMGAIFLLNDGTNDGQIADLGVTVTTTGEDRSAWGWYVQNQQKGALDLTVGKLSVDLTATGNASGFTLAQDATSQSALRFTDDVRLNVVGEGDSVGMMFDEAEGQFTLTAEKATTIKAHGALEDGDDLAKTSAIYSHWVASEEGSSTAALTFQDLTVDTAGVGIWAQSGAGAKNTITVNGAFRLTNTSGQEPVASLVFAQAAEGGEVAVAFQGAVEAERYSLFEVYGEKASVTVDSSAAKLTGNAIAGDKGTLTLNLSSADSLAKMHLKNSVLVRGESGEAQPLAGTVNVALANEATWQLTGTASQINRLTLTSKGHVDMTNARPLTRDAGGLGEAYLMVDELAGDGGLITLRVNTETALAQQLHIKEKSAGHHKIAAQNAPGVSASGQPILVVVSEGGTPESTTFNATFEAAYPLELGEKLYYTVGRATDVNAATERTGEAARTVTDTNPHNWYFFADVEPPKTDDEDKKRPTNTERTPLTNAAQGQFATGLVHYLAATHEETLRERMGDVHTVMPREAGALTPWVVMRGEGWRATDLTGIDNLHVRFTGAKVGFDKAINPTHRLGAYFGYTDIGTSGMHPLNLSGRGLEVGATWTALSEKGTYLDAKLRTGRTESRFSTLDSAGTSVSAKRQHSHYVGASIEVGRWINVTDTLVAQPMAQAVVTHVSGFNATTSAGLRSDTASLTSVLTRVGGTLDARFATTSAHPWTVYGKAYWEREWTAKPEITFNDTNTYDFSVKGSRLVYGLGLEGVLGKMSSWHVDVERSTGSRLREDWQVNAGLRVPF